MKSDVDGKVFREINCCQLRVMTLAFLKTQILKPSIRLLCFFSNSIKHLSYFLMSVCYWWICCLVYLEFSSWDLLTLDSRFREKFNTNFICRTLKYNYPDFLQTDIHQSPPKYGHFRNIVDILNNTSWPFCTLCNIVSIWQGNAVFDSKVIGKNTINLTCLIH